MRHPLTRRATAAALAVITTAGLAAPAASAVTIPTTPADGLEPHASYVWTEEDPSTSTTRVISPYPVTRLRVRNGADHTTVTWQQRPDGQWTSLYYSPILSADIYPVWEDPAALTGFIPAQLRRDGLRNALPAPVRDSIPPLVWNLIPR
ncbi:hypothetical protein [Corynebacterium bovis]|uniref:hypothetical protein n=1 Tax=Corynebacterium bovis TaxID=36808 RepID=UPI003138E590